MKKVKNKIIEFMGKNHFNLTRYKELLELEKNGQISFLNLELWDYRASVEQQLQYNRKKDYFILIYEYLNRIITFSEFRSKFIEMQNYDSEKAAIILENFEELENFTFANDVEELDDQLSEISSLCFEFYEVWDGTMKPMSESEFYDLVKNYYLQLQKLFPSENL